MPCAIAPVDQAVSQLGWGKGYFHLPRGRGAPVPHLGIDFMADAGAPVLVAHEGTVVHVGHVAYGEGFARPGMDELGHNVVISHGVVQPGMQPVATRYSHLQAPSSLRVGQRVVAGDLVGRVGTSGLAPARRDRPLLFFQTVWDAPDINFNASVALDPIDRFFRPLGMVHEGGETPGMPITPYEQVPPWGGRLLQDSTCETGVRGLGVALDPRRQQPLYARYGGTQLSSRARYLPALYDVPATAGRAGGALVLGLAALAGGVWWLTRKPARKAPPWWVRQRRWRGKR